MSMKALCEVLRGEPIALRARVEEVPCNETSDAERLCKRPVVSVLMCTYNHEPYIAQAIEGVVGQQTDFEFELIIGEDASQDRTREICFDYQRRYPDKIRVLWSEENVTRGYRAGNATRVVARARGEFFAPCEGDDYWSDPRKLQKQVDLLRAHPEASFCFTGGRFYQQETGQFSAWRLPCYEGGVIPRETFLKQQLFGSKPERGPGAEPFILTASVLYRREASERMRARFEIFDWSLWIGDLTTWVGLATQGDVCYLPEQCVVYRRHGGGATFAHVGNVGRDAMTVRFYYLKELYGIDPGAFTAVQDYMVNALRVWARLPGARQRAIARDLWQTPETHGLFARGRYLLPFVFLRMGVLCTFTRKLCMAELWALARLRRLRRGA